MVFSSGTARLTRTLERVPNPQKWNAEMVQDVTATPWHIHVPKSPEVIFRKKYEAEEAAKNAEEEFVQKVRRAAIAKQDLIDVGYTAGCPKCDHSVRWGYGHTTVAHPEERRARIYRNSGAPKRATSALQEWDSDNLNG